MFLKADGGFVSCVEKLLRVLCCIKGVRLVVCGLEQLTMFSSLEHLIFFFYVKGSNHGQKSTSRLDLYRNIKRDQEIEK